MQRAEIAQLMKEFVRRQICREILIRVQGEEPGEAISAHTISVTPDTIELDCKEEFETHATVEIRLTDGPQDSWCSATVQHCVGTIIGYTVGLRVD